MFQAVEVGVKRVEELTIVSLINDPQALQTEQLISILYETLINYMIFISIKYAQKVLECDY